MMAWVPLVDPCVWGREHGQQRRPLNGCNESRVLMLERSGELRLGAAGFFRTNTAAKEDASTSIPESKLYAARKDVYQVHQRKSTTGCSREGTKSYLPPAWYRGPPLAF